MSAELAAVFLSALAVALGFQTLVWLVSLARRDAAVADVAWGPGFALLLGVYLWRLGPAGPRPWLALGLVALWGFRLAAHIAARGRGRGEDPRYRAMRERAGASFPLRSLVTVFWLQGALQWLISLPLLCAASPLAPRALAPSDLLGVVLFAIGFAFEAVADAQLQRFRSDPGNRGRVLDRGLWAWSRHPNYFGEAVLWWGLGALGLATPWGWLGLLAPALVTFLLLRVSGVTLLEKTQLESKPQYRDYVARTSAFVPRPPRRG